MAADPIPFARPAQEGPELSFQVERVSIIAPAAAPTLSFAVRVRAIPAIPIRSLVLYIQIRDESERLWIQTIAHVPGFTRESRFELPVSCTREFELANAKFFETLDKGEDGTVPLHFLFGGTMYYRDRRGALRAILIPSEYEARFQLPVAAWTEAMKNRFRSTHWAPLSRETYGR
jgi:hypothetical protein